MNDDDWDHLQKAKAAGDHEAFLDSLGRPDARRAFPRLMALADRAFALVPTDQMRAQRAPRHRKPNPHYEPGLFDASGGLPDLMGQLHYLEYEIDGVHYTHGQLMERLDLVAQLEKKRRIEAQNAQEREDLARSEKDAAFKDANILRVVIQRLRGDAA